MSRYPLLARRPLRAPRPPRAGAAASAAATFGVALAAVLMLAAPPVGAGDAPTLSRLQVLHDPQTGTISRRLVRVIDLFPGQGLEFSWEPSAGNAPGVDAEGFATGPGTLSWHIPGAALYDPRGLAARYEGMLGHGAPEGEGRLALRDGAWRAGLWQAGRQEGEGIWRRADGSQYEGAFRAGTPEGRGRLTSPEGWVWEGSFAAGEPEGEGLLTLASGEVWRVEMRRGHEVARRHLDGSPALRPVQAGGDADRVTLAVTTNARIALEQSIVYEHAFDGTRLQVFPRENYGDEDGLIDAWNGNGRMELPLAFMEMTRDDWLETRAFLDVTLASTDGDRVRLDGLRLVDERSEPWLRPMLEPQVESGCIGSRPWFELVNRGWGPVEEPRLRIGFAAPDAYDYDTGTAAGATRTFDVALGDFDAGTTVDLRPTLTAAGVDVAMLASNRFTCPDLATLDACSADIMATIPLGELAGAVGTSDRLQTLALGTLDYTWTDAAGRRWPASESFTAWIDLARIEVPAMAAEMGGGAAFATPAPDFHDLELPVAAAEIEAPLPLRGNPNTARAEVHLQLHAARSSSHRLRVEAAFADGSVASSMPIDLFFLSPRAAEHHSAIDPGTCFLPPEY